jgi:nucleotide-binding universal stress UspA family protein
VLFKAQFSIMPMIKNILVCLEGSASSESAARVAVSIARECAASVTGMAIIDEPDIRSGSATGIGGSSFKHDRDESLLAEARKNASDWIALFTRRCQAAQLSSRTLEIVGRPAASILEEMQSHDLTVIGRDANFRFATNEFDARTRDAILHRAPRPVLLVPESSQTNGLSRTVLVAYDGSGAAKRAIHSFAASGLARARDVHLATVDDVGELAWRMANQGVQILREEGVHATLHNIVSPLSNTEALAQLAKTIGAGLMVMGTFSRSRLAELFSGSATRGLVEKTTIPLFMQH